MLIEQAELRTLIPHRGTMILLDGVLAWDEETILCTSTSHLNPANPLRRDKRLPALAAFEYGAQAMAVHGGLLARQEGRPPRPAYLAALRNGYLYVEWLDALPGPLEISAQRLMGDWSNAVYQCRVRAGANLLAEARITVMAQPDSIP